MFRNKKTGVKRESRRQTGGGDWGQNFHAYVVSPAELSWYTLQYIDQAPIFHPLQFGHVFPTGTTGITPTGVYLANQPALPEEKVVGVARQDTQVLTKAQVGGNTLREFPVYYSMTSSTDPICGVCNKAKAKAKPQIWTGAEDKGYSCNPRVYSTLEPVDTPYATSEFWANPMLGGNGASNGDSRAQALYQRLMGTDRAKLVALCQDNMVRVYNADKTGRMLPRDQRAICQELAHKLSRK